MADTIFPERGVGVVISVSVGVSYPVRVNFNTLEDGEDLPEQTYTEDGRWWHDNPPSLKHVD